MPFLFVWAIFALSPVTISVFPPAQLPPAPFRVRAIVARHADNRRLWIEIDGPEYKRSLFEIEGAQAQRVFEPVRVELRAAGEYVATATLVRIEGGRERNFIARQPFRVLGLDDDERLH